MKKIFSFLSIISFLLLCNCSKIEENNDPVIGIWSNIEVRFTSKTEKVTNREEWIFNDAYLGRYHHYNDKKEIDVLTDFQWSEENGLYTITYPGLEDRSNDKATMIESEAGTILKSEDGQTLAIRE